MRTRATLFVLLVALLVAVLSLLGCASPEAVDLRLVPDPNLNSEAEVLAALDTIVLVVDSPDGLYPPGSERSVGSVQIEDADADPSDLELVATIPVTGDRLPIIRLERGTLPDASLELRFLGLPAAAGAPASVVGRVQGVHLSSPIEELAIPFNLRPELLPPRVTEILPTDGGALAGCVLSRFYVMFSRPVDPATLAGAITVEPGVVESVRLDPSGLTAEVRTSGLEGADELRYAVTIATTVTDLEGRALDQVPSDEGPQPFGTTVALTCSPPMDIPVEECQPGASVMAICEFRDRLQCVDGFCVPRACDFARCADTTVCDPATGRCELDCRSWGDANVCPAERPSCDASGLCI